jgi:hypothetical protein
MSKLDLKEIKDLPGCYKIINNKKRRPVNILDIKTITEQLENIEHIDIKIKDKKVIDINWIYAVDTKKQAITYLKNAIKFLEKEK